VLIAEINPDVSITIVDSTPLRSSKGDKEAKIGVHVTIGFYKLY